MTRARENANLLAQTATGNINLSGILTVGAGGTTSIIQVGTGSTIHGSGDIAIAGTIYAFDVVTPLKIDTFSPANGATNVSVDTDIRITFDQGIGIGTTGYVYIDGPNGNLDTYSIGSTYISRTDLNKTLVITPSSPFSKGVAGAANTITTVVDASFIDNTDFTGINTTGGTDYSFEIETVALGEAYEGGYLVCVGGGVQWIVAPSSTEVSRNWFARNDAVTTAEAQAACGDWFVPTSAQLYNPGYTCRTYWDSYTATWYQSSTEVDATRQGIVNLSSGQQGVGLKSRAYRTRAFRCVSY